MSANFYGSPFHPRRRPLHGSSTMDLDTTADVHEEHTADLEPATADIVPTDVSRPTLASTTPPKAVVRSVEESPVDPGADAQPVVARDVSSADTNSERPL